MQVHEPLHDGQADAEPALRPVQTAVGLCEQVEDARQHVGPNADAVVPHPQRHLILLALDDHVDPPAWLRVLRRVRDEIGDDLHEARRVPLDVRVVRRQLNADRVRPFVNQLTHALDGALHDGGDR